MSQLLSTLDVAMLQENDNVFLQLMQQNGFSTIEDISFRRYGINTHDFILIHIYQPEPTAPASSIKEFFEKHFKIQIELSGIITVQGFTLYRIISAEVSQVKITATYDVCTVQSVLAAAVKEQHAISPSDIPGVKSEVDFFETISMPDTDMIEDAAAQIAYKRFDEETMHSSAREIGRSSVEKRWVK